MNVPQWYALLLLALAAWRIYMLLALDSILDKPRRYVTGLGWEWKEGKPVPKGYREWLAEFIECPYCLGFWVGLAWWGAWQAWPHGTLVVAAPFAISAGIIGAHKLLSST